jgi:hypothetical protein
MLCRYGQSDCSVLVKPFMRLHEEENPLLLVMKDANLPCMEQVRCREAAHNTGNMLKHDVSSVSITLGQLGSSWVGIGINAGYI